MQDYDGTNESVFNIHIYNHANCELNKYIDERIKNK